MYANQGGTKAMQGRKAEMKTHRKEVLSEMETTKPGQKLTTRR
jgi:hypothetical protein